MRDHIAGACLLILLSQASCATGGQKGTDCLSRGYPTPVARVDSSSAIAGTNTVTDREVDVFPDPGVRTWMHLDALRTMVRRYRRQQGDLPKRLEDVSSLGDRLPLLRDGWGYPVVYSSAQGEYELRAAAADGLYCSEDDVVMTEQRQPPYPSAP